MSAAHVCPHESQVCDPETRRCHLCLQAQCAEEDRRDRVIATARGLLAPFFIGCRNEDRDAPFSYVAGEATKRALICAEEFEHQAAAYRETGE